ncbi:sensor histidine kinase [Paenibacillus sp. GCM10023250]|uniref:sensor histidine kinase n=1 Tax=Paenibacillus sp. GCM10023250 TaxID=3252648 RepID=UPI00361C0CC3
MFVVIVYLGVLAPILSVAILLMLRLLDHELDILELENVRIRLEKELHVSKYNQLNEQIQPHFLFNTLNALLSLSRLNRHRDLTAGLERFSLFLRYRYRDSEQKQLVSFRSELEHTNNYLMIQQLRFGPRLKIDYEIDSELLHCQVPPYTLQTLVENAFKHGLEQRVGEKYCFIGFKREGNWVELSVVDNGTGDIGEAPGDGIGLSNVRQRLELIFDLPTSLTLRKNKWNQTAAMARWPYVPGDEGNEYSNR